jgi:ubiquinone/menaquinone biosynthesis C-methylase UbiE
MLKNKMDAFFYPALTDNWDDTLFRNVVLDYLSTDMTMLDVGAGSGHLPMMNFKGVCEKVVGVDPDEAVLANPNLDEAHVAFGEALPFDDESFDICISDNVWEHIEKPVELLREVRRVLKPGGFYLAKTPNKFHYVSLIAQVTPHWFHEVINSLRGRSSEDTFETLYRLNSKKTIEACASEADLEMVFFRSYEGRPEYMRISALTYLAGIAYERLVNFFGFLERFRVIHIVVLIKAG